MQVDIRNDLGRMLDDRELELSRLKLQFGLPPGNFHFSSFSFLSLYLLIPFSLFLLPFSLFIPFSFLLSLIVS